MSAERASAASLMKIGPKEHIWNGSSVMSARFLSRKSMRARSLVFSMQACTSDWKPAMIPSSGVGNSFLFLIAVSRCSIPCGILKSLK